MRTRIPLPLQRLRVRGEPGASQRALLWLGLDEHRSPAWPATCPLGRYRLGDSTFFAHVGADAAVTPLLSRLGHGWSPAEEITDGQGRRCASVWRDERGNLFLPFDLGEVMQAFWSESYRQVGRSPLALRGRAAAIRGYYLLRPALPRPVQLRLRRTFSAIQTQSSFPNWPAEDSLHVLYAWLFRRLAELASRPVPFIGLWPHGHSWALVLTHDVETSAGCESIELLREPERMLGYRSSWNLVPLRYQVSDETVSRLRHEDCEVGVHGLRHDGRDLGSPRLLAKRLPAIREHAERWQAVGFRSPATQRRWELMPRLGFDYDSSYSDTDPYEPQPGGCCTYLPFFNESMVELPITLPQDHTIFAILGQADAELWVSKARHLRERGAMVLALTHPDYASDPRVAGGYRSLLESFSGDRAGWNALPREVATWWRQRAGSALRRTPDGWRIDGPASATGRIQFATADGVRARP
ncbi:MAG TPA: hypothetical protein VFQ44_21490 [Streptosporangiaceae bacterium]|nr:hypothetical protein [Streptosporangiaceae bacterium]